MSLKLDEILQHDSSWEQLRKPFIAVLTNLDGELKEIKKELHTIKRRLDTLEGRGRFFDGVTHRLVDTVFKIAVTVLSVYLLAKFGLS